MSDKIAVNLGDVQKTAFLPLWGRAIETQKPKPLLVDKTAVAIIEKIDYDFSTMAHNLHELTQAAWILRSICVDEAIRAWLVKYPQGTIVNIGCGLDTTFDRVDNGTLTWYDLDLQDIIQLRRQFIAEMPRRKFISASFLEEGWLDEISAAQHVFFFAAGVFYYFEAEQIRQFLIRLADHFQGSEIMFDVSSPYGVKVANKVVIQNSGLDKRSYLKWGLDNTQTILSWDRRIRLVKVYRYFGSRARSLKLKTRLWGILSDRLKIQYMVHYRLGDS